jgi:hypothetical protein
MAISERRREMRRRRNRREKRLREKLHLPSQQERDPKDHPAEKGAAVEPEEGEPKSVTRKKKSE